MKHEALVQHRVYAPAYSLTTCEGSLQPDDAEGRVSRAVLDPVEICLNIAGNVSENMSVVSGVFKNTAACI